MRYPGSMITEAHCVCRVHIIIGAKYVGRVHNMLFR